MLPPPKKIWNRFASKVISKLSRLPRPAEAITRTTRRLLGRLETTNDDGRRRCCRCSCHFVAVGHEKKMEYWLQVHHSFWSSSNNNHVKVEGDQDQDHEGLEYVDEDFGAMEDQAVDERAEEFIAKFHQSLKLERLQHF